MLGRAQIGSIRLLVGIAVAAVAALALSLPVLALRIDGEAAGHETEIVQASLRQAITYMMNRTESGAVWDETFRHVDPGIDEAWVIANLATTNPDDLASRIGLVVGWDDHVLSATEGGRTVAPARLAAIREAMRPVLDALRTRERIAGEGPRQAHARLASEAVNISAYTTLGGRPALVVGSLIESDSGRLTPSHDRLAALLLMSDFETFLLPPLADQLRLPQLAVRARGALPGFAAVPLADVTGRPIAFLSWRPSRPGTQLLVDALPPILLVVGGLVLAVILASRRVDADAQALIGSEARANHLAQHDQLTGLANRRSLTNRLETILAQAEQSGGPVAVLLLDLDRFKSINDSYGHQCGDEMLREMARRLGGFCRPGDVCARLGGDEFVFVAPGCGPADAEALASRVVERLGEPVRLSATTLLGGASIGVCVNQGGGDAGTLLFRADLALLRAKQRQRGSYELFTPAMEEAHHRRHRLETELRAALANAGIDVAYQPIYQGPALVGVEALARWTDPEQGPVSPSTFAPLAEECGLIDELGMRVAARAFADSRRWPDLFVAINLSAVQLRARSFVARLSALLVETGARAGSIEFEITENAAIRDDPAIRSTFAALRAMGFRLTLDDFGTGYASFRYLRDVPIGKIKIDRSFIARVIHDRAHAEITRAILRVGAALGLVVVAEGVETEEQRDWLARAGCAMMQGFLLGRPTDAADIDQLYRRRIEKPYQSTAGA